MGDEFLEHDLDTPTEHDVDEAYGSRFLGVTDVGDKKIRTKISKVRKEEIKDRDTGRTKKRLLVFFDNIDKPLVLNATNKNILVDALGKAPIGWTNASVGILVDPNVSFGGKKTGGVRLRVLEPVKTTKPAAKAAAKPEMKKKPAAKSDTSPPQDEEGDPGFDPDLNDAVPDFTP